MVINDSAKFYVDYGYIPFSRSQCIKRLIFIWALSFGLCFIGKISVVLLSAVTIINIIVSIFLSNLMIKYSSLKTSRFLFDGITLTYFSIIFILLAYRLLSLLKKESVVLLLIMFAILLLSMGISWLTVYTNIKKDKYTKLQKTNNGCVAPFLFGTLGYLSMMLMTQNVDTGAKDNTFAFTVLASVSLLLSVCFSVGSLNFIKFILYKNIEKTG